MSNLIDKLALIDIKNHKVLVSMSKGKDVWYIPGGKREGSETDHAALTREVKEELDVDLEQDSIVYYGTFEAPAHEKPGMIVRMTCYTARYTGTPVASSEIDVIDYFRYEQKHLTAEVDQIIFDDLKAKGLIA